MKKIIYVLSFLSLFAQLGLADILADGSNIFTSDTKQVTISSITASPTQILTSDPFVTRTWIINLTSFTVLVSTISTGFNLNTTAAIPPCVTNTSCQSWTPDGPIVPYWGQLFAVEVGTSTVAGGNSISVFRVK